MDKRPDPIHLVPLFAHETRDAIKNCCDKAQCAPDPLPMDQMHDIIPPNPNSKHQLTEHPFRRSESKIEAFHDCLSNFGNSGMRDSLADNLNLMGTARHNMSIRHKRSFVVSKALVVERTPVSATRRCFSSVILKGKCHLVGRKSCHASITVNLPMSINSQLMSWWSLHFQMLSHC